MKTRLITLLTMGRTLDWARDRKGAYTLRYVNKFPKFRPAARAAAGTGAAAPPAGHAGPAGQSSLFAVADAPAAAVAPENKADGNNGNNGNNGTNAQAAAALPGGTNAANPQLAAPKQREGGSAIRNSTNAP
jgi:hypothetical protein